MLERGRRDAAASAEAEFRTAMVETASGVCAELAAAGNELRDRRSALASQAREAGVCVLASASHPTADPSTVPFSPGLRYQRIAEVMGPLADQALVCGCHLHVAVPDRSAGVAVLDRIRPWLAVLLAISANSPMWQGRDTGYASWRAQAWNRLPTAGPTSMFGSLARYEQVRHDLVASGAALDEGMLYFDARLSERYPTVEVRVADVCLDVDDTLLIAGLARALVMTALAQPEGAAPDVPVEVLRAAAWVASKYGLSRSLLHPAERSASPAYEVVWGLRRHVQAALEESGDIELVDRGLARLSRSGTGADRQREVWVQGGADAVLALVALQP